VDGRVVSRVDMSWDTATPMLVFVTKGGRVVGGAGSVGGTGTTVQLRAGVVSTVEGTTSFTACAADGSDTGRALPAGDYELVGWVADGELPDGRPAYVASAPLTVAI
jgi:hypothetical protein